MNNFKRKEVSQEHYKKIIAVQAKNGTPIKEQIIGARKKIFIHNRLSAVLVKEASLDLNGLSKPKFTAFLGMFQRTLYKQFRENESLYDIDIKFRGISRRKNRDAFDKIRQGTVYYNIDLSSAYWQIAHKLGYISENVYKKYMDLEEYKTAKRFCITFLGRRNSVRYLYPNGDVVKIKCDNSVFHNVYKNIRNYLYSEISDCEKVCENCIEKNIDGISVISSDFKKVSELLKEKGLVFKMKRLIKISKDEYFETDRIRKF